MKEGSMRKYHSFLKHENIIKQSISWPRTLSKNTALEAAAAISKKNSARVKSKKIKEYCINLRNLLKLDGV